jgi:hypothetical protein
MIHYNLFSQYRQAHIFIQHLYALQTYIHLSPGNPFQFPAIAIEAFLMAYVTISIKILVF